MAQPRTKRERPKNAKGTLLRILHYSFPSTASFFGLLLIVFAGNGLSLLGPSLAGKAVGAASAGKGLVDFSLVYRYAAGMLFCYLASSATTFIVNIVMMRVGRGMGKRMREDVFNRLMELPVSYFDRNQAGDIISRVSYDIDVVTTSISTDIVQILTSAVTVTGSLVMMIVISPPLAVITLITIPLAVFYTKHMNGRTRPLFSRRSAAYGKMNGFVEEKFSGIRTIQAYDREEQMGEEFAAINREAAEAYEIATSTARHLGPTVGFINNLSLALVGMVGSLLFIAGRADLEKISSFVLYSRKFSGPISEIANITNEIYSALAAAERVFRLLDQESEPADCADASELPNVRGEVELTDVSFGYTEDRIILKDIDLHAAPGQLIAIVGPTGAGKTVVAQMMELPAVNADKVARQIHKDPNVLAALCERFGQDIARDGVLNRTLLAARAFATPHDTEDLNAIMHPRIVEQIQAELDALKQAGHPLCVLDAPLLFEANCYQLCDTTVAVLASRDAGIDPNQITAVSLVGNTAMHHLLLGIDPKPLTTPLPAPTPPWRWAALRRPRVR